MYRILFAVVTMSIMLALSGCGDGGRDHPTVFKTDILSDPRFDGDIEFNGTNVYTVTQGNVPGVFAGIDPLTGYESRAFLYFPLTGAGGVPGNAIIDSAKLDIFIASLSFEPAASSIPIRIELVSFSPPTLQATDYERTILQPLAVTAGIRIFRADLGRHVEVDVTPLMVEAQRLGLTDFQIRIMEDLGIVPLGLIEIDDTTSTRAPLLTVTYF